jgi:uncharacterized protein
MELHKLFFDTSYLPGEIEFVEGSLRQATPLRVAGSAELAGVDDEIRLRGRFSVRMQGECDRCLETATFDLDAGFDLFYRPEKTLESAEEVHLNEGEIEIGFYRGEGLDLRDVLREQVLLALPMQRICREDCKGLCSVCGTNRNLALCSCEIKPQDDRWAALKNFTVG